MAVTEENRQIARLMASVFGGGKPSVVRFWDEKKASCVDVLSSSNSPVGGVTSVGSIGLSEHTIGLTIVEKPLRVEVVGACASTIDVFANVLATCAFHVINSAHPCSPGVVFADAVSMYVPNASMKHVLLVPPFLWHTSFGTMDLPGKKVTWLQMIPISDQERAFASENGTDALETLFEERQIDVFDLYRASVV